MPVTGVQTCALPICDAFKDIEGEADTLAGLILEIKGEMPHRSETITYREHKFTVLEVDNRRIKKIKYEVCAAS